MRRRTTRETRHLIETCEKLRPAGWLGFGIATAAVAWWVGPSLPAELGYLDGLLLAASLAGLWTALGWMAAQAVLRSTP